MNHVNPIPPSDDDGPSRRRATLVHSTAKAGAVLTACVAITIATLAFSGDEDRGLRSLIAQGPFGALLLLPPVPPPVDAGADPASGPASAALASGLATVARVPAAAAGSAPAGGITPRGSDRARAPMVVTTVTPGRGVGRPARPPGQVAAPVGSPAATGLDATDDAVAATAQDAATLVLDDGRDGQPEIVLRDGRPGSIGSMTIRVRNSGSAAAPLVLRPGAVTDVPGPLGGVLSARLLLRVLDADGGSRATTSLAARETLDLGAVPAGGSRRWRIELEFPDGGPPPTPTTGDNVFQGSAVQSQLEVAERGR